MARVWCRSCPSRPPRWSPMWEMQHDSLAVTVAAQACGNPSVLGVERIMQPDPVSSAPAEHIERWLAERLQAPFSPAETSSRVHTLTASELLETVRGLLIRRPERLDEKVPRALLKVDPP